MQQEEGERVIAERRNSAGRGSTLAGPLAGNMENILKIENQDLLPSFLMTNNFDHNAGSL